MVEWINKWRYSTEYCTAWTMDALLLHPTMSRNMDESHKEG